MLRKVRSPIPFSNKQMNSTVLRTIFPGALAQQTNNRHPFPLPHTTYHAHIHNTLSRFCLTQRHVPTRSVQSLPRLTDEPERRQFIQRSCVPNVAHTLCRRNRVQRTHSSLLQRYLVFHVVADYDSGPDLWSIRRHYFSWTAEEINEERDLGNQFAITSHPVPDFYLPAPREYVSNDLEPDVTTIRELCWLIDEELAKPDGHQRCKHPYTTENTSRFRAS